MKLISGPLKQDEEMKQKQNSLDVKSADMLGENIDSYINKTFQI